MKYSTVRVPTSMSVKRARRHFARRQAPVLPLYSYGTRTVKRGGNDIADDMTARMSERAIAPPVTSYCTFVQVRQYEGKNILYTVAS